MLQIKGPVRSAVWVTGIFWKVQPNYPLYVEREKKTLFSDSKYT